MIVRVDTARRRLAADGWAAPCTIGRGGVRAAAEKREGDGATPRGRLQVRGALLRPNAGFERPCHLPWRWIRPSDGWCDDPSSSDYNRPVFHPFEGSAEELYRASAVYDVVLPLGYNDDPPYAGHGSAIFLHLVGDAATEGCIAVDRGTMSRLLLSLERNSVVEIF